MKLTNLPRVLGAVALSLPQLLRAQPTAHYVPGSEGIKAASLPPPGVYLRDYNLAYFSTRRNDAQGNRWSALDKSDAFVYANVPRLLWITEKQFLGGFLGVDALLPIEYTQLDLKAAGAGPTLIDHHSLGLGDFFIEGTWSKHIQQFDFALAYGIWAPTGDSAAGFTTRAGLGYWTHMFTAGATWYVDAEKKWAISALNRFEINMEKNDTEITPGPVYTVEGGVSYTIEKTIDLGAVGYYQQKMFTDSGPGSGERDRVAGIGPEVGMFYPKVMFGWSLRYLYEFMAESRLQGSTVTLTLTKRF